MTPGEIKIVKVEYFTIERYFIRDIVHGLAKNYKTGNLIIRLTDEKGRVGYGEGVPRFYVTGETFEGALKQINQSVPDMVCNRTFSPNNVLPFSREIINNDFAVQFPSVACALEIALLDLSGKALGVPCSSLLDQTGDYQATTLIYSAIIPIIKDPNEIETVLKLVQNLKFRQVKLKLGFEGDMTFLEKVRIELGESCDIRVDVNGAWTPEQTLDNLPRLVRFGVSCLEEPIKGGDLLTLAEIREKSGIPLMADESVCSLEDAARLINNNAVDALNLKLSKLGGASRCLEIAQLARSHGVSVQLGCQVGELGILSAAGRHIASVIPGLMHLEGCLTRFFVRDVIREDLSPGPGGFSEPLNSPGLGITIIEQELLSG
jgi:L-Ala-D/L-Glu epimerase